MSVPNEADLLASDKAAKPEGIDSELLPHIPHKGISDDKAEIPPETKSQ